MLGSLVYLRVTPHVGTPMGGGNVEKGDALQGGTILQVQLHPVADNLDVLMEVAAAVGELLKRLSL